MSHEPMIQKPWSYVRLGDGEYVLLDENGVMVGEVRHRNPYIFEEMCLGFMYGDAFHDFKKRHEMMVEAGVKL